MDLTHIKKLKKLSHRILVLFVITTAAAAYSTNTTINNAKTSIQPLTNTNTSPFSKVVLKRSGKAIGTKKQSTPYIQVLNLNEAKRANFSLGSAKITKKGQAILNLFAKQVITSGITPSAISIVGHTDNIGAAKANKHLSEKRAIAVANYLASKGLDNTLMHVTGHGDTHPVATNESQVGRAQNRRVFIRVYGERNP
jgi:outer membrane protein OmpA-like peptidoglycan-associated protein